MAMMEFAQRHGATWDPALKKLYVVGEVRNELIAFVPKERRIAAPDISPGTCPLCGATMIKRMSSKNRDVFWSCIRFPRCRGTRQWDQLPEKASRAAEQGIENVFATPRVKLTLTPSLEVLAVLAIEKLMNRLAIERWLTTPKVGLRGSKPIDVIGTEEGMHNVIRLLREL